MSIDHPVFVSVETSAYSPATLLASLPGGRRQTAVVGEIGKLMRTGDSSQFSCSCGQKTEAAAPRHIIAKRMHLRATLEIEPDRWAKSMLAEDQPREINRVGGVAIAEKSVCPLEYGYDPTTLSQ